MTTQNDARGAIYTAFDTDWGGLSAFTFDNENFDPPAGANWARLVVRHDARVQESLGAVNSRKFQSGGSVIIQCFTPLDKGVSPADTLSTAARAVFEGKTLTPENIRFTAAVVTEIGPTDDWYQVNVEAFFTYTETK